MLAWEIARKLINLTNIEREKIFGYSDIDSIIRNNSASVVYNKIMEYEKQVEEEKIEVGNIVKCNFLDEGIVTSIDYNKENEKVFSVIFTDGIFNIFKQEELTKTGRTVDILNVLRGLFLDK